MAEEPRYASYLLRLWMSEEDGLPVWRASLESTRTRQRRSFAGMQALVEFLETEFDSRQAESGDQSRSRSRP
jgi:hypothetical protein